MTALYTQPCEICCRTKHKSEFDAPDMPCNACLTGRKPPAWAYNTKTEHKRACVRLALSPQPKKDPHDQDQR